MLRSPRSSPRGGKGWCRQERLCANLPPYPGHKKGDPVSELTNWLYGTAAASSPVAVLGNKHLYEGNYGGRRENSTEAASRRAPSAARWVQPWRLPGCLQSLPAGSRPSCRQRAHSHSSNRRQPSTGTGGALCVWLSWDTSCPEKVAARCFSVLQGGCWGSLAPPLELRGGCCATRLHHSPWDWALAGRKWRGEAGDSPALLPGLGTPACWEPATNSGSDTFSSCPSPRSVDPLQPQGPRAQRPAQLGAAAKGHPAQGSSAGTAGPPQLAGP